MRAGLVQHQSTPIKIGLLGVRRADVLTSGFLIAKYSFRLELVRTRAPNFLGAPCVSVSHFHENDLRGIGSG